MSDKDEPTPSKVTKIDVAEASMDMSSNQDVGQEEWLSEGVLTDDGYYDAAEEDQGGSNAGNTSQDDSTMNSINNTTHLGQSVEQNATADETNMEEHTLDQSIEDSLQQLSEPRDSAGPNKVSAGPKKDSVSETRVAGGANLDSISEYLVRKPKKVESEGEDERQGEEDDGNNTDELLQMLGDDKPKKKKMQVLRTLNQRQVKAALDEDASTNEEDPEEMIQAAKIKTLKVVQSGHNRKQTAKIAVPEELSDSEMSTDGAEIVQSMFKQRRGNQAAGKSTKPPAPARASTRQSVQTRNANSLLRSDVVTARKRTAGPQLAKTGPSKPASSTPLKQYVNKQTKKKNTEDTEKNIQKAEPPKKTTADDSKKNEAFDSDQEMRAWADGARNTRQQRLMQPERMDEEIISDEYSGPDDDDDDDDGSFYNEMPSSESEDIEEWFALDVRAERAGDYIPLLGHKAYELLTEEKRRVESKLSTLRSNISDLSSRSQLQGEQIDSARRLLAELDTQLAHS